MKIYKVGGCVRDEQLGLSALDIDYVVVGSDTKNMLELGFSQIGKDFPVFLHPQTHEEYALARQERKYKPGHQGFIIDATKHVSLYDDLKRRDITINAMAKDINSGELIDPFDGLSDIKARLIRHVSPAFSEDPLRILRVARFAARFDFTIAKETLQLMQSMVINQELNSLSQERVWLEISKALRLLTPVDFFNNLQLVGATDYVLKGITPLLNSSKFSSSYRQIDCSNLSLEYSFIILCYFMAISNEATNLNAVEIFNSSYIPKIYRSHALLFINNYPLIKQLSKLSVAQVYQLSKALKLTHKNHKLSLMEDIIVILNEAKKDVYLKNISLLYAINNKLSTLNYATIDTDLNNHIKAIKEQQLTVIANILHKDTNKCI